MTMLEPLPGPVVKNSVDKFVIPKEVKEIKEFLHLTRGKNAKQIKIKKNKNASKKDVAKKKMNFTQFKL